MPIELKVNISITDSDTRAAIKLADKEKINVMELKPSEDLSRVVEDTLKRLSLTLAGTITGLARPLLDAVEEGEQERDRQQGTLDKMLGDEP